MLRKLRAPLPRIPWTRSSSSSSSTSSSSSFEPHDTWKWLIRQQVWDTFRMKQRRFPVFDDPQAAAEKVRKLPEFREAQCLYVSPDAPQRPMRAMVLTNQKKLLVSRLPKGLFTMMDPVHLSDFDTMKALEQPEFKMDGIPIGLDARMRVQLLVTGSVAVDPKTGARLGKGEGYFDMEYAILRHLNIVNESTLVVTTVHDDQLVIDLPEDKLLKYDVPVDVICTPKRTIYTQTKIPKPSDGILWECVPRHMLSKMPVLRELKDAVEKKREAAVEMAAKTDPPLIAPIETGPAIFIKSLNPTLTEQELKSHLEQHGLAAEELSLYRTGTGKNVARAVIAQGTDVEKCVTAIDNTKLKGWIMRARRDKHTKEEEPPPDPAMVARQAAAQRIRGTRFF
ncbi:5-formyltetrahydrofolate cyclo-ligase-like protein COG0212 [Selaginella moellendorffii]|uniref:5-formyltetrahydrofolate cyclo-ligase-like protein COG0212 n=1 Tax=Selaginella moellendorffii TaxID=88036 RepID=UPI000D1C710D|nr:5-formyltetrahydrofolate cyclo-ligase-like protein COG0212 [Selaginella moellendorffii]|eukprot:XP_024533234.1 5-formyltetrahydrofolate cyclo-ligase-like protein COG0212 [Selaginella moellendorffii]